MNLATSILHPQKQSAQTTFEKLASSFAFHTNLWTQNSPALGLFWCSVLWKMYQASSKNTEREKSEFIKKSANCNTLMDEARGKHLSYRPEIMIGLLSESWGLNAPCNFIPVRVLLLPLYINKSKFLLLSLKYAPPERISQQCNFTIWQRIVHNYSD